MIFETHAHYDDEAFDGDREQVLSSLPERGIGCVIDVGASMQSTRQALEIAKGRPWVFAAIGVHPGECLEAGEGDIEALREMAGDSNVVAIGEIGLDYHWEKEEAAKETQRKWFLRQLKLAREAGLPVIIHSRDAAEDTLSILRGEGAGRGVVHCYSYSPEMAEELVRLGYMIGVGGVVTFKNAKKLKETVRRIPLESLLLETDCPYMAPEPHRGERNFSGYLPLVAEKIAEIKGIDAAEVERATWNNAARLFSRAGQRLV